MSLLLVPARRENLEVSVERSIEISVVRDYLPSDVVENILKFSGNEGIRCWALTQDGNSVFKNIKNGDEVLFSENGTNKFSHYGIIIAKFESPDFGNAIWPFARNNPWKNIYFLANIFYVNIDKRQFLTGLGYSATDRLQKSRLVDDSKYEGTISQKYLIPIYDNVAEADENKDFFGVELAQLRAVRVGHARFSKQVKTNYGYSCAVCGLSEPEFLIAGHISSWAEDPKNRLNPRNGICLCSLHDKAFEHGYLGLSDDFKIIVSKRISPESQLHTNLRQFINNSIRLPKFHQPDRVFLRNHRKKHSLE